jgi:hypothetical protein
MRINESHKPWAYATITVLAVASALYIPYASVYPGGAHGNTIPGLIYGILGYGMMLFAGLKGARKKVPVWRIGRAQTWMRGHLWMGALSLPMILFHAGFRAGGRLSFLLLVLLFIVVLSGIAGAVIQHFVPRMIMSSVPLETIFDQIPHVREKLREEANEIFVTLCGEPRRRSVSSASQAAVSREHASVAVAELSDAGRENLHSVYHAEILPFLRDPDSGASPLANPLKARKFFDALRRQSPSAIHQALGDLEAICEEERQLTRQRHLHYWLHGWLLVHVPVSITLLVLGAVHAFAAIRY